MKKPYVLTHTKTFLKEVLKIIEYKAENDHADATSFYQNLCEKLETIRKFPEMGAQPKHYPRFCARGYRFMLFGRYNIFYSVRGQKVYLMRLRHASRNPV